MQYGSDDKAHLIVDVAILRKGITTSGARAIVRNSIKRIRHLVLSESFTWKLGRGSSLPHPAREN